MLTRYAPQSIRVDAVIGVDENVTHSDDFCPWHPRHTRTPRVTDAACRLSYLLNTVDECVEQHSIVFEVLALAALHESDRVAS